MVGTRKNAMSTLIRSLTETGALSIDHRGKRLSSMLVGHLVEKKTEDHH